MRNISSDMVNLLSRHLRASQTGIHARRDLEDVGELGLVFLLAAGPSLRLA